MALPNYEEAKSLNGTLTLAANSNLVLDHLEKYPCRMPLIVLCIETVAQGV